jgi:hypothetical protein
MELKELVGMHELSGVDMNSEKIKKEWGNSFEDCQIINFILDGKTYSAIEDPEDGYRSTLREIRVSEVVVKNILAPVQVLGTMRADDEEVIDFLDTKTGKIVLAIGTEHFDGYYPYFVAEFTPENMILNAN